MIDAKLIRDNYARMTDEELIYLANNEGQDLSSDAWTILHDEFTKRKLNASVFETMEENRNTLITNNILKVQEKVSNEFINSVWTYALDQKKNNISNQEICKGIMQRGLDEEHALLVIKTLGSKAKEVLNAHQNDMIKGGIIFAVGAIITITTYTSALNGGSYIIAWGAIIFGAIRFLRGMSNIEKDKTIISNIENENNSEVIVDR